MLFKLFGAPHFEQTQIRRVSDGMGVSPPLKGCPDGLVMPQARQWLEVVELGAPQRLQTQTAGSQPTRSASLTEHLGHVFALLS